MNPFTMIELLLLCLLCPQQPGGHLRSVGARFDRAIEDHAQFRWSSTRHLWIAELSIAFHIMAKGRVAALDLDQNIRFLSQLNKRCKYCMYD